MHSLTFWFGFVGAWLLFAGPVHQASVELRAESHAVQRMQRAIGEVDAPPQISKWWWLLPPVRLVMTMRHRNAAQKSVVESLPPEDYEQISHYVKVARGWFYVAGGAWLIALKETYELIETRHWPVWVYVSLIALLTLGAFRATESIVDRGESRRGPRGGRIGQGPR